ncbi:MAG: hypothetical protein JWN78_2946, partial [Bacteroidota bacterium]|nr:hypothetical protein [Bacteroidota bacterium]
MIKVALNGGLGNQLFQYAAGRALAVKNNTKLFFDVIPLYSKLQLKNIATYRKYELGIFSIDAQKNDIPFKGKLFYPLAKMLYFVDKYVNKLHHHYFEEKDFSFDEAVLEQPDNTYLDGHFQSEKYFKHIENIIREELIFKNRLSEKNSIFKSKIENSNAVSIHIRRGDYVLLQKNVQKHGVASTEYYNNAIAHIAGKIALPYFFIFTDDITWVKENFKTNYPFEIVDSNQSPGSGYIDMQLMSLCKHNIICNSTFSWWSAWLNKHPEKIVIAPSNWFADSA